MVVAKCDEVLDVNQSVVHTDLHGAMFCAGLKRAWFVPWQTRFTAATESLLVC